MFPSKFFLAALSSLALIGSVSAFHGDATFFAPGLGACGDQNTANDLVVALNAPQYGNGENCRRNIRVTFQGRSVVAKVEDKCPVCVTGAIDLSPAAFNQLADPSVGRIQVDWDFI
ncbi:riboflavine-aldehyde-forming enzyme [Infundibulicybe gibba]|nr:riboflavine-aldehyde-forming enzyme [Infundibulicybe gibba]